MVSAFSDALSSYVEGLLQTGDLLSDAVEHAFRRVRRHRFLDHWYRLNPERVRNVWQRVDFDRENPDSNALSTIYSDCSLITEVDGFKPTTSTSQPRVMSRMLELLDLQPGMRVLEIGTGTGYNAALIAEIVGDPRLVSSMEIRPEVAAGARAVLQSEGYEGIRIIVGDGALGDPGGAPYDRIIVTAGGSDVAPSWIRQLVPDGRLLIPMQHGHLDPLLEVRGDAVPWGASARIVGEASFIPLAGLLDGPNPWQGFLIGGLSSEPVWGEDLPPGLPPTPLAHPLLDPTHRSFYFFLTLCSRELWRTNEGYGLADPHTGDVVLLTSDRCVALSRGSGDTSRHLLKRLRRLWTSWDALGRPTEADYRIQFLPRHELPVLLGQSEYEWVVERTYHLQVVRLPS